MRLCALPGDLCHARGRVATKGHQQLWLRKEGKRREGTGDRTHAVAKEASERHGMSRVVKAITVYQESLHKKWVITM